MGEEGGKGAEGDWSLKSPFVCGAFCRAGNPILANQPSILMEFHG